MTTNYADRPNGLAGNDDAGQISAWYVMSALGFYQVTPGVPIYQIGTPHLTMRRLRWKEEGLNIPRPRRGGRHVLYQLGNVEWQTLEAGPT